MNILDDDVLKQNGLIKDVDTLSIALEGSKLKEEKRIKKSKVIIAITIAILFIIQFICILIFGVEIIYTLASTTYVLALLIVLVCLYIKGGLRA